MKTLIVKDLAVAADLDTKAMSGVRGGCYSQWKMPSSFPGKYEQSPSSYTSTTDVSIAQANHQYQSNPTGNGSVAMGGSIYAYNNQQGFNSVV